MLYFLGSKNRQLVKRGSQGNYGYVHTESVLATTHQLNEFSASFDYVIVFPLKGANHEVQSNLSKHAFHSMLQAGLEVYPYRSVQDDELLLLVKCGIPKLKLFAAKIEFKLKIDPERLKKVLSDGDADAKIKPIVINDDPTITPFSPYEFMYLKYKNGEKHDEKHDEKYDEKHDEKYDEKYDEKHGEKRDEKQDEKHGKKQYDEKLYVKAPGANHPFPKSVRLKLIYLLLRAPARDGGCNLEISNLLHHRKILALFPLHDREISKAIMHKIWEYQVWPWSVPFEDVREYYGEKIALYNVFIAHYTFWLWTPAIIGLVFQLVVWGTGNFSHPVLPFYSLVITVWSIVMLEYWKRTQSMVALEWGMSDFERLEQDRPEFQGKTIISYINGKDMTYYPPSQAKRLIALSRSVVASFIAMICGIVAGIYILRIYLQARNDTQEFASLIASGINTVQIQIFNLLYQSVAVALTEMENHRTDTEYEDRLIVKLFVFQFVNSYASFFYLAFIASNLPRPSDAPSDYLGECGYSTCMEPLSINLAIIFGSRLTVGNFLDIFIPYLLHKKKIKDETAGIAPNKLVTPAERDYMLLNYDNMIDSIQNYADTAVQYGFGLLFITALPCASLCSVVSSYWKVKFNAWKLGTFYQRPVPQGAQDIGTWLIIFQVISVAAVITNAGLVCFTMNVLWKYSLQGRVWIFVGFQWVLMSLQFFAQAVIPDSPEEVDIQLKRMEFINEKVIEKVADEDYDEIEQVVDIEMGDDESRIQKSKTCCSAVGHGKITKVCKFETDFPVRPYPESGIIPSNWPQALHKDHNDVQNFVPIKASAANHPEGSKAAKDGSTFHAYVSPHAAVESKTDAAVSNPVFEAHRK